MNKEEQRISFLKKRILNRLEEMQEYMSSTKYKLYKTMVNDCNSFDEIREIAELDMQLGFIDYVIKLKHSLDENNISIDDIEDISNYNDKSQQLSLILPSKNIKTTQKLDDIDISTLGEDIEDEEVLAAASSILLSRLNAMPPEELYREQLENYEEDELSEEYIDDIHVSYDDLYDNSEDADEEDADEEGIDIEDVDNDFFIDEEDDDEEDAEEDELDFDDIDESELGIDDEEKQDINDIVPDFSNETDDEEDELDFGNNESNDIDNISDDDIFIDNDEESDDDESDDTDWDSLGDDLFEEEDDNFDDDDYSDDESDEEADIDSLGDDLFEEDDNFDDDYSDDESDEDDIDSLGDDLFEEEDDDSFDDYSDDESDEEDDINSLDNIDADDLFCDDYSEDVDDDSEEDDALSDIDNIEDDSDEFDLDDTDFEYDEPTDDAESFDDFFKSKNVNDINNKKKKRDATPQKVFINGSKRGKQTQDMFNILNNMFGGFGRAGSKLGNTFKNSIKAGVNKVNKSSFFNLSGQ